MNTPFIVTKSPKSFGIAILLTLLFGPIGLFYASVWGGLIMTFTPMFLLLILISGALQNNPDLTDGYTVLIIIFVITYWLTNIIWSIIGVKNYNEKLEYEAKRQYELWSRLNEKDQNQLNSIVSQKSPEINASSQQIRQSNKPNLQEWLKANPGKTMNDYYTRFGI